MRKRGGKLVGTHPRRTPDAVLAAATTPSTSGTENWTSADKTLYQLSQQLDPFWAARRGLWAESYAPWHGRLAGILEPINSASALAGLVWYATMATEMPPSARAVGLHAVVSLNLLSSCVAHAGANALACWLDGGSLLWATTFELSYVVLRAAAHSEVLVGISAGLVIVISWRLPLEPGFALGLASIAYLHHAGLDAAAGASEMELSAIREHAATAVRLILLATAFWLLDKLSHVWLFCGHAIWHVVCGTGVAHLVAAAALSHVAGPKP